MPCDRPLLVCDGPLLSRDRPLLSCDRPLLSRDASARRAQRARALRLPCVLEESK
jgi:hypothetical protein